MIGIGPCVTSLGSKDLGPVMNGDPGLKIFDGIIVIVQV